MVPNAGTVNAAAFSAGVHGQMIGGIDPMSAIVDQEEMITVSGPNPRLQDLPVPQSDIIMAIFNLGMHIESENTMLSGMIPQMQPR